MVRSCYTPGLPLSVQRIRGYQPSFWPALESSESRQILFWSWSSASMHPLKGKWNQRLLSFFDNFSQAWHSRPFQLKIILIADKLCTLIFIYSVGKTAYFSTRPLWIFPDRQFFFLSVINQPISNFYLTHTILGQSIYACQPVTKCSLVETTFLLLVTVSTVSDDDELCMRVYGGFDEQSQIFSSNKAIYCMIASFGVSHECESMSVNF